MPGLTIPVPAVVTSATATTTTSTSSHSLKWWHVAGFTFVFTSSGPFGIETCVLSGGSALTFAGVLITPLVYVIPQVLMVSELSAMMPSNHGHVAWVERGWGRSAAAFNAFTALLVNTVDLSLYPVLGGNYFAAHFMPDASGFTLFLVRAAMVLIGFAIAMRSAQIVSDAALVIGAMIVIPFVCLFFYALPSMHPATQWDVFAVTTNSSAMAIVNATNLNSNNTSSSSIVGAARPTEWAVFCAACLWLYTGFNSLGALGGDTDESGNNDDHSQSGNADTSAEGETAAGKSMNNNNNNNNNRTTLFIGLSAAVVVDVLMYLLPLSTALVIPGGTWEDGYLSVAFQKLLPGAGALVSVCGLLSTMGLFVSSLACFSRLIWGMADRGWLPKVLSLADAETHAPIPATIAQVIAVVPLLFVSFSYLQRIEFCLAAVSYILTFTAFLRLRYTEPEAPRPYRVPGGMFVAWLITVSKIVVFVVILVTNFGDVSLIAGVVVVQLAIAGGYYWLGWGKNVVVLTTSVAAIANPEELHEQHHQHQQNDAQSIEAFPVPPQSDRDDDDDEKNVGNATAGEFEQLPQHEFERSNSSTLRRRVTTTLSTTATENSGNED